MTTENRRLKHNLAGARFGKWTVISHVSHGVWNCVCDCGFTGKVNGKALRKGTSKSCKCGRFDIGSLNRTHGQTSNRSPSPEYISYGNMLRRCLNPNNHKYPSYGGRGITVCERWVSSYENFFSDLGPRPSPSHTLDRIDVNGNYEPANCRWADIKTQNRNKRSTVIVEYQGASVPLVSLCEELGLKYGTIHNRMFRYGMTLDQAIGKKPKISEAQIKEIIAVEPYLGVTVALAKKYGVSNVLIGRIRRGLSWSRYYPQGGAA